MFTTVSETLPQCKVQATFFAQVRVFDTVGLLYGPGCDASATGAFPVLPRHSQGNSVPCCSFACCLKTLPLSLAQDEVMSYIQAARLMWLSDADKVPGKFYELELQVTVLR